MHCAGLADRTRLARLDWAPAFLPAARVSDPLLSRIEELEVRVAFQEDLLASLNASVSDTTLEMRVLRTELVRMRDALDGVRVSLAHDVRDEPPPPHY